MQLHGRPACQHHHLHHPQQHIHPHIAAAASVAAVSRRRAAAVAAAAAAAGKGFGAPKKQQQKPAEGCPCGSGKTYKECCKPQHSGTAKAPASVEATVRARFAAMLKKNVSYLLATTSPHFHSFHYGGEPGGAARQLEDDLWNTVEHYEYSRLRIREVRPSADSPGDDATVVFQYSLFDKRTPTLDDQGNKARRVQIEESRFLRDPADGLWKFSEYRLVEVPEALARAAEEQAQDMAAAQQGEAPAGAA